MSYASVDLWSGTVRLRGRKPFRACRAARGDRLVSVALIRSSAVMRGRIVV
jgi:hypothetical protein